MLRFNLFDSLFFVMSVRMRHTRAHTKNRRSHHALSEPSISINKEDGINQRHRVSPVTGKYKGTQVLEIKNKVNKKNKNKQEEIKEEKENSKEKKNPKKEDNK